MKKRLFLVTTILLITLLLMLTVFSGCSSSSTDSTSESSVSADESDSQEDSSDTTDTVKNKVAVAIPLTGNLMQYGVSYKNAIEMAVKNFNEAGGINGTDVVVEFYDDKGDQKEAINLANKIVEDEDVFAVIGSFGSSVSMAAAPVYQEAQMPFISPNSSHPDFPGIGDMMVPISPTTEIERIETMTMIFEEFGGEDLAILHQNTDLGVSGAEISTDTYTGLGGNVIIVETFTPNETKDFTPILSKIKAAEPGIVYVDAEYNDTAAIMIQANQIGLTDVQFVGPGNSFKVEFLEIVGNNADGMILCGTTPVYLDSVMEVVDYGEVINNFTAQYNETYTDVKADGFAASAYDAAMMAFTAAKMVGTDDPYALIENMLEVHIEPVSGSSMSYENGNELIKGVYKYIVVDGQFQVYEP